MGPSRAIKLCGYWFTWVDARRYRRPRSGHVQPLLFPHPQPPLGPCFTLHTQSVVAKCVGHQAHDDGGYACHVLSPPSADEYSEGLRRRILGGWVMFRAVALYETGGSEEVMPQDT